MGSRGAHRGTAETPGRSLTNHFQTSDDSVLVELAVDELRLIQAGNERDRLARGEQNVEQQRLIPRHKPAPPPAVSVYAAGNCGSVRLPGVRQDQPVDQSSVRALPLHRAKW